MKQYELRLSGKPTALDVGVAVQRPCKVRIRVLNPNTKGCIYTDRWSNVKGKGEFEVRLPQSSEKVLVIIDCPDMGNDDNVRITKLKRISLNTHKMCLPKNRDFQEFLKFAQWFCENAGAIQPNRYYSDKKNFTIDYFEVIRDKGRVLTTPARISNKTGRIEIAKKYFARLTVPMRFAILCHEYSHFNLNVVQSDEIEADLNALKIYLGSGYPIIEAHKSFLRVFQNSPTKQNKERYEYLKTFIDNFDELKYRMCIT